MAYTTINKSTDYFNTVTFTGDGSLPRAITGVGHSPDFVWLKNRSVGYHHQLYDSVRGTSAGVLYSSANSAEDSTYQMSSFDSDGFTMGSNLGAVNGSGENIVAWNWKANGASSSNTDGSINSTVSVNTTAGFSIVSYTGNGTAGATIGHGLGNVPKMIIIKQYSSNGGTENWGVYHNSIGNGKYLFLNLNNSEATSTGYWNNTTPTSSVFTLGNNDVVNNNTVSYIAYCFAEKTGYSKFGSYTGNGNADGTFVYTGFKPSFILRKCTTSATAENWVINDNKRDVDNVSQLALFPNNSNVEDTATHNAIDICSNGFKVRTSDGRTNGNNNNYIYMAFAEAPLVGSNNVPCTAR